MQLKKVTTLATMLCASLTLGACQTVGSGTSSVTCETIKFVYLSRKDTTDTIKQVVGNNAAWVAACGNPKRK